jgi:hypothetical protein
MFCPTFKTNIKAALREFDTYVDAHIDTALSVTTAIKNLLTSPVADVLTAIIPGTLDDIIRTQLIKVLTKVITALSIVDSCKQFTDANEKLTCFIAQLKQHDPQLQDAILQKLASLLAGELDGNRLKQNLYDLFTQAKYTTVK